jgi:ketosteroid isomerase-like protein
MTPITEPQDPETVARSYLAAVGNKDLNAVAALLAPDITFVGPAMSLRGSQHVLAALRHIGAIHVGNEIKRVFVADDEVCVIYDFVTDTMGSVATIEWLRIEAGQIRSVNLYYDQLPWQTLRRELAMRASQATA